MENKKQIKLELSITDTSIYNSVQRDDKWSWESGYPDSGLGVILGAFYGMLIGASWTPSTVIDAFREFVEEHDDSINDENE